MQLLDAINTVLSLSGQSILNNPNESELHGSEAKEVLRRARREVLLQGWAINTILVDLTVGSNGKIAVASSYLTVALPRGLVLKFDSAAGGLFVWSEQNQTWHDKDLLKIEVTYDIPDDQWTAISEPLASYIAHHAANLAWIGNNRGQPNEYLRHLEITARTKAINAEPPRNLNRTSGFVSLLSRFNRGRGIRGG